MATTLVVGNDGNVVLPSGMGFNVRVWAANVSFVSSEMTGFAHSGKARRLGVIDITGSLGGTPTYSNASTARSPFGDFTTNTTLTTGVAGTLLLALAGGTNVTNTSATGAILSFGAVFNSYAFNVDKNGDSTLTVNYEMNATSGPSIVWSTGA